MLRRHSLGVFRLMCSGLVLLQAVAVQCQEVKLPAKSHRETWTHKDFEWTYSPVIVYSPNSLEIRLGDSQVTYKNEFAGVTGEIQFCCGASGTIYATLADGTTKTFGHSIQNALHVLPGDFRKNPVKKLAVDMELVDRKWNLSWLVGGPVASTATRSGPLALFDSP
jgi:hypothetical protein